MDKKDSSPFEDFLNKSDDSDVFDTGEDISVLQEHDESTEIEYSRVQPGKRIQTHRILQKTDPKTGSIKKRNFYEKGIAGCNHAVAYKTGHPHLPYIIGKCREGHMACSNCLKECAGCHTAICPKEYGFSVGNKHYCYKHKFQYHLELILYLISTIFFHISPKEDKE